MDDRRNFDVQQLYLRKNLPLVYLRRGKRIVGIGKEAIRRGVGAMRRQGAGASKRRLRRIALLAQVVAYLFLSLVPQRLCGRQQGPGQTESAVRAVLEGVVCLATVEEQRALVGGALHLCLPRQTHWQSFPISCPGLRRRLLSWMLCTSCLHAP